jgi:phosphoglycerate dehydrogenase-like enzyme
VNRHKLVILSRSFAKACDDPLRYLDENEIDYELVRNDEPENTEFIAQKIGDAQAVITGSDIIDRYVMDHCPNLKLVSKHGVGLDSIDLKLAAERGITVTKTPDANNESVADLTVMLMLSVLRNFVDNLIKCPTPDWHSKGLSNDLYGKTVGLVGYGKIGKAVAKRLVGFNAEILVSDPFVKESDFVTENTRLVRLENLLRYSDIVSLHVPLTEATFHMIDKEALDMMRDGAILINTSRGALVDDHALYQALIAGRLKGVGLDVFSVEPPVDEPLLTLHNVVATPHIAPHTMEANYRMGMAAARNVVEFFRKEDAAEK